MGENKGESLNFTAISHSPMRLNKIYNCKNNRYKCKFIGKYFNVKTRTIFENTKLSLKI